MIDAKHMLHTNTVLATLDFQNSVRYTAVYTNEKTLDVGERWESNITRTFVDSLIARVKNPASDIQAIIADALRGDELEQVAFCVQMCEEVANHFQNARSANFITGGNRVARPVWLKRIGDILAEMPVHMVIGAVRSRIGIENMIRWELVGYRVGEWTYMVMSTNIRFGSEKARAEYIDMRCKYRFAFERMSMQCADVSNLGQ
jgi:hypothetical protein